MEFTFGGKKNDNNEMNMKHDDSISLFSTFYRTPLDLYELGTINESSCVQITSKFRLFCSLEGKDYTGHRVRKSKRVFSKIK